MTLMMTSAQVVETSVNVTNSSPSRSGLLSPGRSNHKTNILLAFLETWVPLSNLDMKQLTLKTVTLVALTSAQSQTLAALDVGLMKSGEKGSEFIVREM